MAGCSAVLTFLVFSVMILVFFTCVSHAEEQGRQGPPDCNKEDNDDDVCVKVKNGFIVTAGEESGFSFALKLERAGKRKQQGSGEQDDEETTESNLSNEEEDETTDTPRQRGRAGQGGNGKKPGQRSDEDRSQPPGQGGKGGKSGDKGKGKGRGKQCRSKRMEESARKAMDNDEKVGKPMTIRTLGISLSHENGTVFRLVPSPKEKETICGTASTELKDSDTNDINSLLFVIKTIFTILDCMCTYVEVTLKFYVVQEYVTIKVGETTSNMTPGDVKWDLEIVPIKNCTDDCPNLTDFTGLRTELLMDFANRKRDCNKVDESDGTKQLMPNMIDVDGSNVKMNVTCDVNLYSLFVDRFGRKFVLDPHAAASTVVATTEDFYEEITLGTDPDNDDASSGRQLVAPHLTLLLLLMAPLMKNAL